MAKSGRRVGRNRIELADELRLAVENDNLTRDDLESMNKAYASCPASLSFIFKACPNKDPVKMGSVGVGCTIDHEVEVEAEEAPLNEVLFNSSTIHFPTLNAVVSKLAPSPTRVSIKSSLPLGYGFGISGAAALAAAFAINKLFNMGKSRKELVRIAHIAEVENHTGLGSVATQVTGGFLVKNKPGIPVDAYHLPFVGKKLYAVIIDRLETPTVLHDEKRLAKINKFADEALKQIKNTKDITLEEVIEISYENAKKSGLLQNKKENQIIDKIRKAGGHATMSMLGYVVLSTIKFDKIVDYPIKELVISDKRVS